MFQRVLASVLALQLGLGPQVWSQVPTVAPSSMDPDWAGMLRDFEPWFQVKKTDDAAFEVIPKSDEVLHRQYRYWVLFKGEEILFTVFNPGESDPFTVFRFSEGALLQGVSDARKQHDGLNPLMEMAREFKGFLIGLKESATLSNRLLTAYESAHIQVFAGLLVLAAVTILSWFVVWRPGAAPKKLGLIAVSATLIGLGVGTLVSTALKLQPPPSKGSLESLRALAEEQARLIVSDYHPEQYQEWMEEAYQSLHAIQVKQKEVSGLVPR